ncbi:alpha-glucosidase [Tessaracoccus lubricantis]|uniref:Alpha-glucosidase n=1 Tax=Tessaracoccus lubricantis TaxID=545543 RepID=A0ABP9EXA9_9ACTN
MSADDGEWWKSSVVYQVYPRSFADSDGDGIGDLAGLISRLDHLARLGVDVVWLSPVYPSPQVDNGYDISDYQGIDPVFGDLATFDRLVAELHSRGMKLVIDIVVNHTSDQHPWFQESRSAKDNPKRDWYWWREEPTNWRSFFSGPTWTRDEATGEYYLHLFAPAQPDLNWENPDVRRAVAEMMRWWLDRGVDGFRMDVINLVSKDPALPKALDDGDGLGDGSAFYTSGPRIHQYLAELRARVLEGHTGEVLFIGEMPGVTIEHAALFTDPARAEVDLVFQFEHVSLGHQGDKFLAGPLAPGELVDCLERWQRGLADVGWNSSYLGNHDQPRMVSRFGDDSAEHRVASAKALATVLLLQRGTPFIYQGDELGMTNSVWARPDDFRDVESLNYWDANGHRDPVGVLQGLRAMGRDNARTPMQWDSGRHAGFTTGAPWLPANPNHVEINAAAQYGDPGSVFEHYRGLIALRHTSRAISHGTHRQVPQEDPAPYCFVREAGTERVEVWANLSSRPTTVRLESGQRRTLAPWESGFTLGG